MVMTLVVAGVGTLAAIVMLLRVTSDLEPTVRAVTSLEKELTSELEKLRSEQERMARRTGGFRQPGTTTGAQ